METKSHYLLKSNLPEKYRQREILVMGGDCHPCVYIIIHIPWNHQPLLPRHLVQLTIKSHELPMYKSILFRSLHLWLELYFYSQASVFLPLSFRERQVITSSTLLEDTDQTHSSPAGNTEPFYHLLTRTESLRWLLYSDLDAATDRAWVTDSDLGAYWGTIQHPTLLVIFRELVR